mmetsp:Transcript_19716/g.38637  ORF Transcript_19716/g.38637 Transcript_19716/m.38637 type:complete len:241 (+) Transcript_19716:116-838(+)
MWKKDAVPSHLGFADVQIAFRIDAALSELACFLPPEGSDARPYTPPAAPKARSSSAVGAFTGAGDAACPPVSADASAAAPDAAALAAAAASSASRAAATAATSSATAARSWAPEASLMALSASVCKARCLSTIICLKRRKSSAAMSWEMKFLKRGSSATFELSMSFSNWSGSMSTSSKCAVSKLSTSSRNSLWIWLYSCLFSSSKLSKATHLVLVNSPTGWFQVGARVICTRTSTTIALV